MCLVFSGGSFTRCEGVSLHFALSPYHLKPSPKTLYFNKRHQRALLRVNSVQEYQVMPTHNRKLKSCSRLAHQ